MTKPHRATPEQAEGDIVAARIETIRRALEALPND